MAKKIVKETHINVGLTLSETHREELTAIAMSHGLSLTSFIRMKMIDVLNEYKENNKI